ncbi:MAG: cytochrome d ubiquinol oxidase subunit II [Polyangiaceae bacterium]
MPLLWFAILAAMLTTYVVLDGLDFGAGIAHLFIAKTDEQRRTVLAAIGPVWDGNEVWLIASGGVLFFAFPRAYAAATSGFYLPLMIVLWMLIFRGLSIELRSTIDNPLWRTFWDVAFAASSILLAFVFGATFGNLVRGVPIDDDGYFSTPLFNTFWPSAFAGAIDAYTASVGLFAVAVLGIHGALFVKWKTSGEVAKQATIFAKGCLSAALILDIVVALGSAVVRPDAMHAFASRPLAWLFAVVAMSGAVIALRGLSSDDDFTPFAGSCLFLAGTLLAGAVALSPVILRSTIDPSYSLDAAHAASGAHGLSIGLYWFTPAITLAVIYVVMVFRATRGKTDAASH